jgi:hypothetical protein
MPITRIDPHVRRHLILSTCATLVGVTMPIHVRAHSEHRLITVWKHADCGCCKSWIKHLEDHGFKVLSQDVRDTAVNRAELGMPSKYGSCHTAMAGDYVIEGHVPATDIQRLLKNHPKGIIGLAVPGMPVGSPGMEVGKRRDAYNVLLVHENGSSRVYQNYPAIH